MHVYGSTGSQSTEPGRAHPAGDVHAVDARGASACGLKQLEALHDPPRAWRSEPSLRHCPVCIAALASEADLAPAPRITPTNVPH